MNNGTTRIVGTIVTYGFVGLMAFLSIFPFVWMLLSSLKPEAEVRAVPPTWWPETITLDNYSTLFTKLDFPTYFLNSAIVALLFYTRAVAILGAARGAVFAALVPTFSLLIAIPLLKETPTQLQLVGVLFVTAGMMFALGLHDPAKWRSLPTRAVPR